MTGLPRRRLFFTFLRLGATAYGGPAATAQLKDELVGRLRWVTEEDFAEGIALCQVIPGATMVQLCMYVSYRLRGPAGALLAAVAFILPAFVVMMLLSAAYVHWASLPLVRALFRSLGAVVVAIVLNACLRLWRTSLRGWPGAVIASLALVAMLLRVNFMLILAGAAGLAILLYRRSTRRLAPSEPVKP
jgi:chromate transporter